MMPAVWKLFCIDWYTDAGGSFTFSCLVDALSKSSHQPLLLHKIATAVFKSENVIPPSQKKVLPQDHRL